MMNFRRTFCLVATASVLAFAPSASANNWSKTSAIYGVGGTAGNTATFGETDTISFGVTGSYGYNSGSSETASFFFRKGFRKFEKGDLEKAEEAFRAVLRADGSEKLDEVTLHYLAYINQKQGDEHAAKKYASAYFDLVEK